MDSLDPKEKMQTSLVSGMTGDKETEAFLKPEEMYRSLVESSGFGIAIIDFRGRFTFVNEALCKMIDYSKRELLGKHFGNFLHSEDKPTILKIFLNAWKHPTRRPSLEFRAVHKKGHVVHMYSTPTLYRRNGRILGFTAIIADMTERKKIERTVLESRQKFERLFMGIPEAAVYWDSTFHVLEVNPRFTELFGYSLDEIRGKYSSNFIVPDDKMEESNTLGKKAREGYIYHDTVRKRKDGSLVPVSMSVAPMIVDGQPAGYVGLYKDITERKRAEDALQESEERYRSIFENARDLIVTIDLEGNITSANDVLLHYGYDKDELVGRNVLKIFPQEKWQQQFRNFLKEMTFGKPIEGEFKIKSRRKKGYTVVEFRSNPIIKDNKIFGTQIISRDMTERKEMEEKLKQYSEHLEELVQERTRALYESEKRYSVLVEEATDWVAIVQDKKIVFSNKKGPEITGHSMNELIGLDAEKVVCEEHRQEALQRHKDRILGKKSPSTIEVDLATKKGDHIPAETSFAVISYQGRPAVLYVTRDLRTRKKSEEERLKLEKLATLGELATMVAHDLRNPLTSIRNASYHIKNTCPAKTNAQCKIALEMLDIIQQETVFANNIISDLLDFSVKRPLHKTTQNINNTIESSVTKSKAPENIDIKIDFAKKATASIDEKQLERVFLNLIKNAVQAMPKGGKLTVKTTETKEDITIAFTDTGTGIAEENINKLFSPLFTTKAKGIGMGLAICKKIVEEHGGTIEAQSRVGQGTTFTIRLPKKEASTSD